MMALDMKTITKAKAARLDLDMKTITKAKTAR